jgi:hypothetical protein
MADREHQALDDELASQEFFANPYPLFRRMREEAPVYWSNILNSWVLTRYDDVVSSLLNTQVLSSADRMTTLLDQLPVSVREDARFVDQHYAATLPFQNPPEHTRIRGLVSKAFTPRVVESMRPQIQTITDHLLDAAQGREQIDLIRDFAFPLPVIVISALMGVPRDGREELKRWTNEIFAIFSSARAQPTTTESGMRSLGKARDYLGCLIAERTKRPQEDLISHLITVEEHGKFLSAKEIQANSVTFFVAGHETTTNMIGLSVLALLKHPEQLSKLRDNPSLITPAVEELLRYDGSLLRNWRVATEDIEIRGKRIRKGQMVSQMLGAANRDPAKFPDPDRLDISRHENRHLAFGHGIHFCLGAPLARLELHVALATFIRRFPRLRPGEGTIEWRRDYTFRGVKTLPVRL